MSAPLDLDALEDRARRANELHPLEGIPVRLYAHDISALVAELRRLREQNTRLTEALTEVTEGAGQNVGSPLGYPWRSLRDAREMIRTHQSPVGRRLVTEQAKEAEARLVAARALLVEVQEHQTGEPS